MEDIDQTTLATQKAFDQRLIEIVVLTESGSYDAALAILDTLQGEFPDVKRGSWLSRSIAAHRGLIFAQKGDLVSALKFYQEAQDSWHKDFPVNQRAIGQLLARQGKFVDAALATEEGLKAASTVRQDYITSLAEDYIGYCLRAPTRLSADVRTVILRAARGKDLISSEDSSLSDEDIIAIARRMADQDREINSRHRQEFLQRAKKRQEGPDV